MARDGRLTEQQAWQKIYEGFQRGICIARKRTLRYLSAHMNRLHAFRAVYWSGAAIMLRSDVALRIKNPRSRGLDHFLKDIKITARRQRRAYRARESALPVIMENYARYADSAAFPVNEAWLAHLGIHIRQGKVFLDDRAPLSHIRKAITLSY